MASLRIKTIHISLQLRMIANTCWALGLPIKSRLQFSVKYITNQFVFCRFRFESNQLFWIDIFVAKFTNSWCYFCFLRRNSKSSWKCVPFVWVSQFYISAIYHEQPKFINIKKTFSGIDLYSAPNFKTTPSVK